MKAYGAHYEKRHPSDMGILRVYVRNPTEEALELQSLSLNGQAISAWMLDYFPDEMFRGLRERTDASPDSLTQSRPDITEIALSSTSPIKTMDWRALRQKMAAQQVLWCFVSAKRIPPGGIAEAVVLLRRPLAPPFRMGFAFSGSESPLLIDIPGHSTPLHFTAVNFSPSLDQVFIYLESSCDRDQFLHRLEVDGLDRTAEAFPAAMKLSSSGHTALVLPLRPPFAPEAYLTVKVVGSEGQAVNRIRIASFFPLHSEDGNPRVEWNLDSVPFANRPFRPLGDEKSEYAGAESVARSDFLLECMNHRFAHDDDGERAARLLLMRHHLSRAHHPERLTLAHVCRGEAIVGLSRFCHLSDIVSVNPGYLIHPEPSAAFRPDWLAATDVLRLARRMHAPRPVTVVLSPEAVVIRPEVDLTGEFRKRFYAALGAAPKGILYRPAGGGPHGTIARGMNGARAIAEFNASLRPFLKELAIAEAMPGAVTPWNDLGASVHIFPLLAGDRGIMVILVATHQSEAPDRRPGSLAPFRIDTPMIRERPSPKSAVRLAPAGPVSVPQPDSAEIGGQHVVFLPLPEAAEAFWIPFSPAFGDPGIPTS